MSVEEQLSSIRAKVREAETQQQRYLAEIDVRRSQITEAMKGLKDQGIDTLDEARQKIEEMDEEIQQLLSQVVERLE